MFLFFEATLLKPQTEFIKSFFLSEKYIKIYSSFQNKGNHFANYYTPKYSMVPSLNLHVRVHRNVSID